MVSSKSIVSAGNTQLSPAAAKHIFAPSTEFVSQTRREATHSRRRRGPGRGDAGGLGRVALEGRGDGFLRAPPLAASASDEADVELRRDAEVLHLKPLPDHVLAHALERSWQCAENSSENGWCVLFWPIGNTDEKSYH